MPGLARFRVNVYYQREAVGAAFRLIPQEIKTLEELNLPPVLHLLAEKPRGLVLVTGPTGSGKSTTLAAIIDEINRTRAEHILTVEDPIEFVHRHKRCIVNQREIGPDASSFGEALKAALRQDPDVILVGEMRDLETISTALTAAETGHLVFGTLHTQSAPSTIDRIIDVFPPEQQEQVRIMIAGSLQAVVTQALLPTADGPGRVAALEVLLPDDAVRNLIRQAKVEQVYSIMQTNTARGMQTMEQALADLAMRRIVNVDDALARSSRPDQLVGILERSGFDVEAALARRSRARHAPQPACPHCEWRGAEMSDSIWKKELSFKKKAKADEPATAGAGRGRGAAPKQSFLKKEISFGKKKEKAPKAETAVEADEQQSFLKKEISFKKKDKPSRRARAAPKPSLLKKEISFGRASRTRRSSSSPPSCGARLRRHVLRADARAGAARRAAARPRSRRRAVAAVARPGRRRRAAPVEPVRPAARARTPACPPSSHRRGRDRRARAHRAVARRARASARARGARTGRRTSARPGRGAAARASSRRSRSGRRTSRSRRSRRPPKAPKEPKAERASLSGRRSSRSARSKRRRRRSADRGDARRREGAAAKRDLRSRCRSSRFPRARGGGKGGRGEKRIVGLKIGASQLAAARVSNNGVVELLQLAREPLAQGIVVAGELREPGRARGGAQGVLRQEQASAQERAPRHRQQPHRRPHLRHGRDRGRQAARERDPVPRAGGAADPARRSGARLPRPRRVVDAEGRP